MKTNDSGRTTANTWGMRGSGSASADHGANNDAGNTSRLRRTEIASTTYTTYTMYYVDAAPALRHTANPAIHLRQRALLALAGRRQRERELLALLDELVVAQWAAKRAAQRRAEQAAQQSLVLQLPMPTYQRIARADEDEAYSPPARDRDLTD